MIKIAFRVLAVRERESLVSDLLPKIEEPESSVMWDEEHKGCMWNAYRTWKEILALEKYGYTHGCILADDAEVVMNFKRCVQMCVEHFPEAVWTFANNDVTFAERAPDTPYINIWSCNTRGICYLMPMDHIRGYLQFYETYLMSYPRWTHDDTTCKMYCMLNDVQVMMPIPNLVIGKDVDPVIAGHRKCKRDLTCWRGRNIDLAQFNTLKYKVSKCRALFPLHLQDKEPVCQMVIRKFKQKKAEEQIYGNH